VIGDCTAPICHLSFAICHFPLRPLRPLRDAHRLLALGYWLCSSEPGAVIHVDWDEKQDAFDQVEGHVGAGESQQQPEWT
jgi:hypothetical protein